MATKIRLDQNWISCPKESAGPIDPFASKEYIPRDDYKMISQHEKIIMFGLVDKQLQDTTEQLREMVGLGKKKQRDKA